MRKHVFSDVALRPCPAHQLPSDKNLTAQSQVLSMLRLIASYTSDFLIKTRVFLKIPLSDQR
jgi:hypothetical protein